MLLINHPNIIDKYGGEQAEGQTVGRSVGLFAMFRYFSCNIISPHFTLPRHGVYSDICGMMRE
ncbi:hypothetical protein CPI84_07680 [Erwinia pyrifoliae]|nr:hypothetical protein EJP617_25480 [Erwinia sp. Ejp617]AUX72364.1 hypothetical protein CPI84_07680 [Erwinia pyrifoliae]MCA8877392.1 hypothetical protein [Erwinia pyrifoliae]